MGILDSISTTQAYFDHLALEWDALQPPERRDKLSHLLFPCADLLRCSRRVLEIGSGTGAMLEVLRQKFGCRNVTGVDLSLVMLGMAAPKAPDAALVVADAGQSPLASDVFDSVICHNSLPHLRPLLPSVRELRRLSTACGSLIILHDVSRARVNAIHGRSSSPEIRRHILPHPIKLRWLLHRAGFRVSRCEDTPDHFLLVCSAFGRQ